MKNAKRWLYFAILILLFQNCGESGENPYVSSDSASVANNANFTWINENIVQPQCVECHNGSLAFSGLEFTTYAGVMDAIVAGEPENSLFYTRSFSTKFFELTPEERETIRLWIAEGAENN